MSTPVLWNTGRKWLEVGLQMPLLALAVPALVWACGQSVAWVALVAAAVFWLRYGLMLLPAARALRLGGTALLALAARSLAVLLLVLLPAYLVQQALASLLQHQPLLWGAALVLAGLLPWLLLLLGWPRLLGVPALGLLQRFMPKASAFGKAWAARAALGAKEV